MGVAIRLAVTTENRPVAEAKEKLVVRIIIRVVAKKIVKPTTLAAKAIVIFIAKAAA